MSKHKSVSLLVLVTVAIEGTLLFGADDERMDKIRIAFEENYKTWAKWVEEQKYESDLTKHESVSRIASMGPAIVPLLIAKIEADRKAALLSWMVPNFTHKYYNEPLDAWGTGDRYLKWWREERKMMPKDFAEAFIRWQNAKKTTLYLTEGGAYFDDTGKVVSCSMKSTELGIAYDQIANLGIDVLPIIVEQFSKGEYDLYPVFWRVVGKVSNGRVKTQRSDILDERIKFTLQWWEANKQDWLLPPPEGMDEDWYLEALKEPEQVPEAKPADGKEPPPAPEKSDNTPEEPGKTPDKPDAK
ncbi:MAG TPA: hypothetical protein PL033_14560 [Candidatus Brocadiia bacterium]|nr:hypothetical protein [Candidatus Brocadiia bacterium]